MITRRQFLGAAALSALGACRSLQDLSGARGQSCCWTEGLSPQRIAVVGDVQRTGLLENLFLGRRQNDAERVMVLDAIAAERPDMLFMLGDQVVAGGDSEWEYFDTIMAPVRAAEIPVLAILGNHDYEGGDVVRAMANFGDRFPHQRERVHGLVRLGDVALLTVDSNLDRLDRRDAERQERRYGLQLTELDNDPSVRMVIVASHHPPYTNSDLSGGSDLTQVEQAFAAPFLAARKTRLYLSGHVHSYERFTAGEKTFVISGGGGGPRREVDTTERRPHKNDAYTRGTLRPFHYVMLYVGETSINAEVRMLQDGKFVVGETFQVGAS